MAITRKVEVDVTPTAKELAEEIWNLPDREQIQLLKCLDDCFYQDSMQGDMQLAYVYNALNNGSEENEIIEKAKHFLSKINDFLIKD